MTELRYVKRFQRHQGTRTRSRVIVTIVVAFVLLATEHAAAQLADSRYVDPKGYFRIVPPAGWRVQEYPQDPRGKVAFLAPESNVRLGILVEGVDFETLEEGVAVLKDIENRLGVPTSIKRVTFLGRPAVERLFDWRGLKQYSIDLVLERAAHNLTYNSSPHLYSRYWALALRSMETYEPLGKRPTDEQVRAHDVAKAYRLAQLMMASGNLGLARDYIKEGLELDPAHAGLLKLKEDVGGRLKLK